ncbi:hypothetical protein NMY22_g19408 [Coprinellus aureogranulatus]|nr:hypothetical protein NMY22_g19408 [Coprinellus aureogranulatus]
MSVFSKLVPAVISAYGGQALFASIFVPQQNEKYYDLCGAIGWLSTTFISLYYPTIRAAILEGNMSPFSPLSSFDPRQLLLSAALSLWSLRLGSFLAIRAIKAGGDSRFDEIKKQPRRFTFFWVAQATWIITVGINVYLVNSLPRSLSPPLGLRDYIGLGVYAAGFIFEWVADYQKSAWRKAKENKQHDEKFITSGLWGISRHPNYLGEIGIWTGIYIIASTALQTPYFPRGTVALGAAGIEAKVTDQKVSGVPPLERHGNRKWGDDPKWQEYKRNVPVFWPWGSRG